MSLEYNLKRELILYNQEDCLSLEKTVNFLKVIGDSEFKNSIEQNVISKDILDQKILINNGVHHFGQPNFVLENFSYINKCAYFDYQKNKIYLKSNKNKKEKNSQNNSRKI